MVKQEVIEQSMSPWNSNPVLVRKSDGSLRFTLPKDLYKIFVGFRLSKLCPFHRHSQYVRVMLSPF
jgi:hypothetical protein